MDNFEQLNNAKLFIKDGNLSSRSEAHNPLSQIEIAEAVAVGTLAANRAAKENNR